MSEARPRRVCRSCGWVQTDIGGSFVLSCPECNGRAWRTV